MKFLNPISILVASLLIFMSASLAMAGGKKSGEKAGTEDINIGVGELNEPDPDNPKDLKNRDDTKEHGLLLPAVQSRPSGGKKPKDNGMRE